MVNYKDWNIKSLGDYVILGVVLLVVIMLFITIVVPLLGSVSTVFAGFGLTDTLLFLILIRLMVK